MGLDPLVRSRDQEVWTTLPTQHRSFCQTRRLTWVGILRRFCGRKHGLHIRTSCLWRGGLLRLLSLGSPAGGGGDGGGCVGDSGGADLVVYCFSFGYGCGVDGFDDDGGGVDGFGDDGGGCGGGGGGVIVVVLYCGGVRR